MIGKSQLTFLGYTEERGLGEFDSLRIDQRKERGEKIKSAIFRDLI